MNKLIISLLAAASSAAVAAAASAPYSLRCEHLEKPLGVNTWCRDSVGKTILPT